MPQQTAQPKGGRKLRRCSRHKNMYAAQFFRTAENKSHAAMRRRRRKEDAELDPKPGKRQRNRYPVRPRFLDDRDRIVSRVECPTSTGIDVRKVPGRLIRQQKAARAFRLVKECREVLTF
jgi:hypothetical protein